MRTARDIIALVIEEIETDIRMAESNYAYAEGEKSRICEKKNQALKNGMNFLTACATYDDSRGFHDGCAFENKERIEALRRRLDFYNSLDERCLKEELQAEAEEEEEE